MVDIIPLPVMLDIHSVDLPEETVLAMDDGLEVNQDALVSIVVACQLLPTVVVLTTIIHTLLEDDTHFLVMLDTNALVVHQLDTARTVDLGLEVS